MQKLMLLLALLLGIAAATPASAKPSFSVADVQCQLGRHCVFPITRTGAATSYSDIVFATSGAAGETVKVTVRFLKADTVKTVAVASVTPGQFTATIKAARYGVIGRGTATGTVLAPPPSTIICPDGQVIPVGTACPAPPPPTTQMCPDGSMIPVTSVCPVAPRPAPPPGAGSAVALMACPALNNGDSLVIGRSYTIVGYAGLSQPGDQPPPAGTRDIIILNDATHRGDGWFGLYVSIGCVATG